MDAITSEAAQRQARSVRADSLDAAVDKGEPVQVLCRDGRLLQGSLISFSASRQTVSLRPPDAPAAAAEASVQFAEMRWLKLVHPVEAAKSAAAFNRLGLKVEILPTKSPFSIGFEDGHVLAGELYGYGAALGGLGLYVADGDLDAIRTFVPAAAIASFTVGERIGRLLLERGQISAQALEAALERQRDLRTQRLGELIVEHKLISRAQLESAIKEQAAQPVQRIGEVLLAMGILTKEQLAGALERQRAGRRRPLGEILLDMELLDRTTLQAVLAEKLGIPYVDLQRFSFEPTWGDLAPYPLCASLQAVPLYQHGDEIVVAVENPLDLEKLNLLSVSLRKHVVPVLASIEDLRWALLRHPERKMFQALQEGGAQPAPETGSADVTELSERLRAEGESALADAAQPEQVSDSTLVRLVNKIIEDAYRQQASDVHIEPGEGREPLRIRLRRDGVLHDYITVPARFRKAVASRIKIMASLDISEHRRPQDGKIDFKRYSGIPLELRVATIPTHGGLESIVLRLLAASKPLRMSELGLAQAVLNPLSVLIERPYGLFLVCGPTGSGKTTTLHSVLGTLNTAERKIWTAEDPVEITQPGLNQVQVHPQIGWTFPAALRSFLRADPDVIMVGEIRDVETARVAVEASLTGHLVLSTLHTNSAPESVTRLLDIGIDPFNFADALLGVLAQRLTRRLCLRCKRVEALSPHALAALAEEYCRDSQMQSADVVGRWQRDYLLDGELRVGRPVGCNACHGVGYKGRIALHELLVATPEAKRILLRHATVEELRNQAMAEGMVTLKQDGIEKMLRGETTIEQVRAVCN